MRYPRLFVWLFFVFCLLVSLTGCVSRSPIVQYPDGISFAAVYTHDNLRDMTSAPVSEAFRQQLDAAFTARNLTVRQTSFESISDILTAIRDTDRRLNALRGFIKNTNYLTLVELSTEFFSQLSGRYRWDVRVKLAVVDQATGESLVQTFTLPAVLMFAHEDGQDAIDSVRTEIERRLMGLVDQFLRGRNLQTRPAPASPPGEAAAPPQGAPPGGVAQPSEAIYFIMIDRFFNAQSSNDFDTDPNDPLAWHGGDLMGIVRKLPYLKVLGITQIWLSPPFLTASNNFFGHPAFHGYWTYDLTQIDPHFGTFEELEHLASEAQAHGIGLILDFVVNHVGYGSPLVESKPHWFHPALTIEDWNDPEQLVRRQVHGLPDLNQDEPEVYDYLIGAAKKWLTLPNITGYRLDAVKHVGLDFWKKFNTTLMGIKPGFILLGEYFDGSPKKVDDIQRQGNFTHMFDFPLAFALRDVFCDNKSLANLASTIVNDIQYGDPNRMVTFIDNHDMSRFLSACHGNFLSMQNALEVMLAMRGIPSIYYGTEVPLAGADEPDNRGVMQFDNPRFYDTIRHALAMRSTYPVLAKGKTATLAFSPKFVVIGRELGRQQALLLISTDDQPNHYTLPPGTWIEAKTRQPLSSPLTISPHSVRVLIQENATHPLLHQGTRRVTFRVPADGFTYAITGSAPALGQWSPEHAPRARAEQPVTIDLPAQAVLTFKLVRFDSHGNATWASGDNQAIFTENTQDVTLAW